MAVGTACGLESTAQCRDTECVPGDPVVGERGKGDEACGASDSGDDELVQVVEDRSREKLAELPGIAGIPRRSARK